MQLSKQIAKQFREVYLDGLWVANTNLNDQLRDVNVNEANFKVENLNTLAALTFHLNYYLEGVLNVFNGGLLDIRDKYSFDFDPPDTEESWLVLKNKFLENAEAMASKIEAFADDSYGDNFVDKKYGTLYRNVHGLIEHGYYHLGQFVIIKKMIRSR